MASKLEAGARKNDTAHASVFFSTIFLPLQNDFEHSIFICKGLDNHRFDAKITSNIIMIIVFFFNIYISQLSDNFNEIENDFLPRVNVFKIEWTAI